MDMGLTHFEGQAFPEGCSERNLVDKPAVDTRNRDRAAFATGVDDLPQGNGTIRFKVHRLLDPIVPSGQRGAMGFHAYRINTGIRSPAAGHIAKRLHDGEWDTHVLRLAAGIAAEHVGIPEESGC